MSDASVPGTERAEPERAEEKTVLGHPPGLYVLFFAEMWERFSFYGMKALLVLYLTEHFLFGDEMAAGMMGTYGSMVYLAPVLGGLIADRYLGFRKSVTFGAILLCIGHLLMAFEGSPAQYTGSENEIVRDETAVQVMFLALAFIIVGVGFLKPSISTIVGQLYGEDDPRRDRGFTIFYMGINLGALTAILLCGYLGQAYGWRYGFGLAGIGMLTGLATFLRGQRHFHGAGEPPDAQSLAMRSWGVSREVLIYGGGLIGIIGAFVLMQSAAVVGTLLGIVSFVAVAGIIWYAIARCERVERHRLLVVLLLTVVSVVFWTLFEQAATSMTLFTERNVHKEVFGFTMQAAQMGFFNPGFIILLAPLFAMLWGVLGSKRIEPSTPMKFGLGVVQAGAGFLVLVYGATLADSAGQVAVIWLVLAYFLHTTGELCLSPVGLSMVTKLAPVKILGLVMGVWFLSSAAAHYVAGLVAGTAAVDAVPGGAIDPLESLAIYSDVFTTLGLTGVGIGILLMLVAPWIKRYMHEHEAARQDT